MFDKMRDAVVQELFFARSKWFDEDWLNEKPTNRKMPAVPNVGSNQPRSIKR
jgi:hypothetical protein